MDKIELPARIINKQISVGYVFQKRTSCRNFDKKPLTLQQLSNILWTGQGVIGGSFNMRRTTPSAGASFPLEVYMAVRKEGVNGIAQGIYQYLPEEHGLLKIYAKDVTKELVESCYQQQFMESAGINIVIAADFEKTRQRYADRGERYVYMEAGSTAQNIYLEVVELGLGTVMVGAFDDAAVKSIFGLDKYTPIAVMPVGMPKDKKLYA